MTRTMAESGTHAWYALRRTLPTWSFEENLAELVEWLPRYGVNEVIVKVDTEEFSHGQPPLAWVEAYQPRLHRVREAMEALGIVYSLNPWITLGHCDRGRDDREHLPGLRTMVGHDGKACTSCACPLSPVWRAHLARIWRLYAETHPHVIWVEDDIRTFNHQPVTFGCFCPDHLARFSERVGEPVSREALVSAMLAGGEPHPWRVEYLRMQGEIMVDTVEHIRQAVQTVDPEISLGLMSSGPRNHCLEGRDWRAFAAALGGDRPLYSRPPMGNYNEESLRGFYYSHDSIKITRHCMPAGTLEQTEVENVPFTQYANSATFTFLEMAISFAYGSHGVTMNLFDHCGTPMEAEPAFGAMLAAKKPFLEGLAAKAQQPGRYLGVRLLHHGESSLHKRLPAQADYPDLAEGGSAMMTALESHGIPTLYEDSPVIAAEGQGLRAFGDDELRVMLSRGMLLDGVAAGVLVERGLGHLIGLGAIGAPVCIDERGAFSAEEFYNPVFGGADRKFLTLTVPHLGGRPRVCDLELMDGAEVISCTVDPDARRHAPMSCAFENELGGRVVVLACDLADAYGIAWNHSFRREMLQGMVRWLGRGAAPVLVNGGVYPLAFAKDCGDGALLGLFNLTLDPWPEVEFCLAGERRVASCEVLASDGAWKPASAVSVEAGDGITTIRCATEIAHDAPLFVYLRWE